jgi:transglutaminase-like putative cysteine protease
VYRYSEPVELGEHRMMFRPRASRDLRLIKTSLAITPRPADLHWIHDVFDNPVAVASFTGRTAELRFESVVTLEHIESVSPEYRFEPLARTYPFAYSSAQRADLARGMERRHPTEDVQQWAARFLVSSGSIDTDVLLRSMTVEIGEQFGYRHRAGRGVPTPSDTLQRGYGTCRDFALLMIEGVRSLGLAARFASGYVFVPDADPTMALGEAPPMRGCRYTFRDQGGSISIRSTRSSATEISSASQSRGTMRKCCRCGERSLASRRHSWAWRSR